VSTAHPAGYRRPPARPTWGRSFGAAFAGYIVAALLTLGLVLILVLAGADTDESFSPAGAVVWVVGAALATICLRAAVPQIAWRIVPLPWLIAAAVIFPPIVLGGPFIVGPNPLGIVAVALLVRYRSEPDERSRPSVGERSSG
jgi:hypothetical protein